MGNAELEQQVQAFVGRESGPPEFGGDLVNEAMIRHWCDAMGDRNPVYLDPAAAERSVHGGPVAPPAMLQAWILPGLPAADPATAPRTAQRELHGIFDAHGYTGVLATDCEQRYRRYLRPGDRVTGRTTITSISEEKATALGIGYFVETRTLFADQQGEEVGSMVFRVLKFKPTAPAGAPAKAGAGPAPPPGRIRAPRGHDNGWWWEAVDRGEVLIQKCVDCGALRHPPRPRCAACRSDRWEGSPASGAGTVYSYVVMHHPPIPGYAYPLPVVLVELAEGVRMVSNLVGCEPEAIRVGMAVEGFVDEVEEGLRLPLFRPASAR